MTFLFSGSLLRYVGYRRRIDYETGTLAAALACSSLITPT